MGAMKIFTMPLTINAFVGHEVFTPPQMSATLI